jgi:hypothetical protein
MEVVLRAQLKAKQVVYGRPLMSLAIFIYCKKKNINDSNKLPEESHTPNRIYATFNTDGSDVKSIAQYDAECKKIWKIHTTDHDDKHEHYHPWDNGHPIQYWDTIKQKNRNVTIDLTSEMEKILLKLRNYGT